MCFTFIFLSLTLLIFFNRIVVQTLLAFPSQYGQLNFHRLYFLFSSVHSLSHVQLFETPWTAACQASLSITNSQSFLKLMSIESVMLSRHLILCHPLLLLPSIFLRIRVISNESVLCIRWPKYWPLQSGALFPSPQFLVAALPVYFLEHVIPGGSVFPFP